MDLNGSIDEAKLDRLERKIDSIERQISALSRILIRRRTATDRGIAASTIDGNNKIKKLEEVGHKRTYIEIGEVAVIPQRKPRRKTKLNK